MTQDGLALQNAFVKIKSICDTSDGRSQLFPFGGSGYKACVSHHLESSADIAYFAVQPGSVEDLQLIVKTIAESRVPFGIKCGGHATNPGFSSTKGVQICLTCFNKINVHTDGEETFVDVGAGCLFGEIYRALAPHKLNIVGGSGLADIGVSGWLLGGGYSIKTSQYGLGIDNIESAGLVLPDGSFKKVSATENADLFFAIKGGGNNFGIVTEFRLKAHPQGSYYDFQLTYKEKHHDAAKRAIATFSEQADSKANLEAVFRCHKTSEGIQKLLSVHCVYDGDLPVVSPFQELRAIEHTLDNFGDPLPDHARFPPNVQANEPTPPPTGAFYLADTLRSLANDTYALGELPQDLAGRETDKVQFTVLMCGQLLPITDFMGDGSLRLSSSTLASKLTSLHISSPTPGTGRFVRGRWGNVMVDKVTPAILAAIDAQFHTLARHAETRACTRLGVRLWAFRTQTMFDNATDAAWPHRASQPNVPVTVYVTWEDARDDAFWVGVLDETLGRLRARVWEVSPAARDLPHAVNTALAETTRPSDLYGEHLERLRVLKKAYDPTGVMCLAGGFKIHHTYDKSGGCGCSQRVG